MYSRLVIDGNAVYEIDEECIQKKKNRGFKERKSREENRKGEKNNPIRGKQGAFTRPACLRKISKSRRCCRHSSIRAAGSR